MRAETNAYKIDSSDIDLFIPQDLLFSPRKDDAEERLQNSNWVANLGLRNRDKRLLEEGRELTSDHMLPAMKLLRRENADIFGLLPTEFVSS